MFASKSIRNFDPPSLALCCGELRRAVDECVSRTWSGWLLPRAAVSKSCARILVDYARAGRAQKRGGDLVALSAIADPVADGPSMEMLALDEALNELEKLSARQARIVELRYFAGLSVSETAEELGVNARTVDRDWAAARVWLRRRLRP
jgi:RNA polymerase sigma factor (TIGR02999 family)